MWFVWGTSGLVPGSSGAEQSEQGSGDFPNAILQHGQVSPGC